MRRRRALREYQEGVRWDCRIPGHPPSVPVAARLELALTRPIHVMADEFVALRLVRASEDAGAEDEALYRSLEH